MPIDSINQKVNNFISSIDHRQTHEQDREQNHSSHNFNQPKTATCEICGVKFTRKQTSRSRHSIEPKEKVQCETCKDWFAKKLMKCKICGRLFHSAHARSMHMRLLHSDNTKHIASAHEKQNHPQKSETKQPKISIKFRRG